MPRTKGAKNILNAKALQAELAKLKNQAGVKDETNVSENKLQDKQISVSAVNQNGVPDAQTKKTINHNRQDVKIKVPVRKKPAATGQPDKIKYRCGWNCGYAQFSQFDKCPQCGKDNTW